MGNVVMCLKPESQGAREPGKGLALSPTPWLLSSFPGIWQQTENTPPLLGVHVEELQSGKGDSSHPWTSSPLQQHTTPGSLIGTWASCPWPVPGPVPGPEKESNQHLPMTGFSPLNLGQVQTTHKCTALRKKVYSEGWLRDTENLTSDSVT